MQSGYFFHPRADTSYPRVAAEILTSELWTIPETIMSHKETLLTPFWDAVIPPLDGKGVDSELQCEKERAHLAFWTDEDEERERKREVIRGLWMRVNASLLQKRTTEVGRVSEALLTSDGPIHTVPAEHP